MQDTILVHHGVKGMKWGVRRYRNKDGSLTTEGRRKYSKKLNKKIEKLMQKQANLHAMAAVHEKQFNDHTSRVNKGKRSKKYDRRKRAHNKQMARIEEAQRKGQQKVGKLLNDAGELKLDIAVERVKRKGWFSQGYYDGTMGYQKTYTVPVSSLRFKVS